jgi:hypothetical protein
MARHRGPVLVDTNVILECWRINAWRALTGGYGVETVEDCVIETQTGYQRRRPEQQIDRAGSSIRSRPSIRSATRNVPLLLCASPYILSSIPASRRCGLTR